MTTSHKQHSITDVIDGGYCIGCGSCTAVEDSPISIELNGAGKYQAQINTVNLSPTQEEKILRVCPFSNAGASEDELGQELFANDAMHDENLGYWRQAYVGHVTEGSYRTDGSSGGFVTWLISQLMISDEIDGVLHVVPTRPTEKSEVFFKYGVSTSSGAVKGGAKSRYYGVEMSQVLKYVRENPGRYLVVGVPCFIKSIRLLSKEEKVFAERIKYSVAILCGHLKSIGYLEFIAWQMGVALDQIESFDFRHKMPENPAKNYAAEITYLDKGILHKKTSLMREFKGEDWGMGLFKYSACDFCDDVMGETADVSAGDAWIEPYSSDPRGTSVIVVRNKKLHDLIDQGKAQGKLSLETVDSRRASQTQEASFRHRRDGLSYRLWLKQKSRVWVPQKRVAISQTHLTKKYKRIFELRQTLVSISEEACLKARNAKDFSLYWPKVNSAVNRYHRYYHPLWVAVPRKLLRVFLKALKIS
ncbi:MAG: Coenzyme F420 hydrogenase/dehydrogenase, beta subunit C-terminal domain [Methylophilus sp.]